MNDFGFQWHITDRCNLRCAHCYQRGFSPASEPPLERLVEIADRIFLGAPGTRFALNLTGGEPFLYPGLARLLRHLDGFDNLVELNVITNGMVVCDEALAVFRESSKHGALKVSIESHDRAVNDGVRGGGSFDRVRGNLAALMEKSGRDALLMATFTRRNAGDAEGLVSLAREVGAAGVLIERFVPLGTGAAMIDEVLTPKLWGRVVDDLTGLVGLDIPRRDLEGYTAFEVMTDGRTDPLLGAACELGSGSMALMPNGDVYPCRRLPVRVGNILEESFDEIRERLAAFRPLDDGDERCLGCRAMALAFGR